MKKLIIVALILCIVKIKIKAQPNCELFKMQGDTIKYQACKKSEEIKGHYQFSKQYQEILDESIAIDPTFDFPYRRKSVAYLKSGDFVRWKKLIDKAVELKPKEHLGPRAWCRFSWFRDYKGAISDIEELDNLVNYDIGGTTNAQYHLHVVRALSYAALGQEKLAIDILLDTYSKENYHHGNLDWFHLGVLYLKQEQYEQAIVYLLKQEKEGYEFSENNYYLALCYLKLNALEKFRESIDMALLKYEQGNILVEDYNHNTDKVFLSDIKKLKQKLF